MPSLINNIPHCMGVSSLLRNSYCTGATQPRCFSNIWCRGLPLLQPGDTCCGVSTAQGHSASGGAETCYPCFSECIKICDLVFGFVIIAYT